MKWSSLYTTVTDKCCERSQTLSTQRVTDTDGHSVLTTVLLWQTWLSSLPDGNNRVRVRFPCDLLYEILSHRLTGYPWGPITGFFPGRGEQRGWIRLSGERKCPLLPMPAGAHWVTRWSETAWSYGYWFWHSTGVWQTDRLTRRS